MTVEKPPPPKKGDPWKLIYHDKANEPFIAITTSPDGPWRWDIEADDDCVFWCADWDVPCEVGAVVDVKLYLTDWTFVDSTSFIPECGKTYDLRITATTWTVTIGKR